MDAGPRAVGGVAMDCASVTRIPSRAVLKSPEPCRLDGMNSAARTSTPDQGAVANKIVELYNGDKHVAARVHCLSHQTGERRTIGRAGPYPDPPVFSQSGIERLSPFSPQLNARGTFFEKNEIVLDI